MPRLRLKVASTGAAYKLELPAGCAWADLQVEARRAVGLPGDADVLLSLNKKTPLKGPPDSSLSSLGICSGDLVWLIGPSSETLAAASPSAAAGACGHAATAASSPSNTGGQAQIQNPSQTIAPPSVPKAERSPVGNTQQDQQQQQTQQTQHQHGDAAAVARAAAAAGDQATSSGGGSGAGGSSRVSDPMEVDRRRAEEGAGDGGAPCAPDGEPGEPDDAELTHPAMRGLPLKLHRLLTPTGRDGSGDAGAAARGGASSGAPESGACGCRCPWTALPPASRCLLVLDCAMGEAGFLGLQDLPELASRGGAFPRQLLYGCSYISTSAAAATAVTATRGGSGASRPPNDEVMGEAGETASCAAAGRADGDDDLAGQTVAARSPVVKLLWYGMGRYLVVHGVPCIGGGGGRGGATDAASGSSSPVTLSIDLAEYGIAGSAAAAAAAATPSPSATAQQQQQQQQQQDVLQLPRDPAAHWRRLKDGLVLPLLAAACRAAGVAPPLGLLVLPLELQMAVLRVLQARDLAALSGVCTTLHRLASEDELWQPLYDKEFGPALTPADTALATSRGYKYLYGRKWTQRAQQRKLRESFRPGPAPWGTPPLAPYVRPPYMPPGAIGGDYDRLPAPLLGGGPPALLGGGRAGGLFLGAGGGRAGGFPGPALGPRRGPWGGAGNEPFGFL